MVFFHNFLLLYLVATVGTGQIHNQLELAGHVVHVLPLERPLLGLVCPRHSLVQVHESVEGSHDSNDPPARHLGNLWWESHDVMNQLGNSIANKKGFSNSAMCLNTNTPFKSPPKKTKKKKLLTIPPMITAPMVVLEDTEANVVITPTRTWLSCDWPGIGRGICKKI